ncbi:MAG: transposase [Arenicella sp.]|nr:transposase [Arenicella sp.]
MTSSKRKHKTYTQQFKEETVALVTEQGYTVIEAAEAFGQTKSITGHKVLLTKPAVLV